MGVQFYEGVSQAKCQFHEGIFTALVTFYVNSRRGLGAFEADCGMEPPGLRCSLAVVSPI